MRGLIKLQIYRCQNFPPSLELSISILKIYFVQRRVRQRVRGGAAERPARRGHQARAAGHGKYLHISTYLHTYLNISTHI